MIMFNFLNHQTDYKIIYKTFLETIKILMIFWMRKFKLDIINYAVYLFNFRKIHLNGSLLHLKQIDS